MRALRYFSISTEQLSYYGCNAPAPDEKRIDCDAGHYLVQNPQQQQSDNRNPQ
jgi:hypothetical protein